MKVNSIIRQQILAGKLTLPTIQKLDSITTELQYKSIVKMFEAMFQTYMIKGSRPNARPTISLPYYAKLIKNPKAMNLVLKVLSKAGWISVSTRPNNNWAEAFINVDKLLGYVTQEELDSTRLHNKFLKYKLTFTDSNKDFGTNSTKTNGKVSNTGIYRNGFAKEGAVPFQYDTIAMHKHRAGVTCLINKGIEETIKEYPSVLIDHANYKEVGTDIVKSLIGEESTYNSGPRTSDPRGRNNAGYLSKVANPVGYKVMRSLLTIPVEHRNGVTSRGLRNKFLFVAELAGFREGTLASKIELGREWYYTNKLHEDILEELPENVWLERLYVDIDKALKSMHLRALKAKYVKYHTWANSESAWHKARAKSILNELVERETKVITKSIHKWEVPIEIDMSASILGYKGLLLNHKPFLERTNIIGDYLNDAWGHPIITNRAQFKTIMTDLYGSQASAESKWAKADIEYTQDEVDAFNYELEHGDMAVAVKLKDFMINNCQMKPQMELELVNETISVICNKFHNVGETTTHFDLYDTKTDSIRRILNTETIRVPDLKSFKRWSVTGLIHNLDGQVANNTVEAVIDTYGWALSVHDALIVCCESADYARNIYANGRNEDEISLKYIHTHRNSILSKYFTSINIPASAMTAWKKVMKAVEPLREELVINPMVLK
jgi:hypothetical protein